MPANRKSTEIPQTYLRWVTLCEDEGVGSINLRMVEEGYACVFYETGLELETALREAQTRAAQNQTGRWEEDRNFCDERFLCRFPKLNQILHSISIIISYLICVNRQFGITTGPR